MIPAKALSRWDNEPARKQSFTYLLTRACEHYRLLHQIGSGGFGVVWSAERIVDQLPVAVKMVASKQNTQWCDVVMLTSPTTTSKVKLPVEVALHQRVSRHEGVITLQDYVVNPDDGNHLIITARPPHVQDLFDFISVNKQLDEEVARGFFWQIVQTMIACHGSGVVHRDLKDENLLVDMTNGKIFLIDFGSSAEWQAAPYDEFTTGTHLYCPPEWVSSGQYHAEQGTVWALGILLYDMIYGDIPFRKKTSILTGSFDSQRRRKLPLHSDALDLMWRCLDKDLNNRPSLQDVLAHRWLAGALTGAEWQQFFCRYQHNQWSRRVANEAFGRPGNSEPDLHVPYIFVGGGGSQASTATVASVPPQMVPIPPPRQVAACSLPTYSEHVEAYYASYANNHHMLSNLNDLANNNNNGMQNDGAYLVDDDTGAPYVNDDGSVYYADNININNNDYGGYEEHAYENNNNDAERDVDGEVREVFGFRRKLIDNTNMHATRLRYNDAAEVVMPTTSGPYVNAPAGQNFMMTPYNNEGNRVNASSKNCAEDINKYDLYCDEGHVGTGSPAAAPSTNNSSSYTSSPSRLGSYKHKYKKKYVGGDSSGIDSNGSSANNSSYNRPCSLLSAQLQQLSLSPSKNWSASVAVAAAATAGKIAAGLPRDATGGSVRANINGAEDWPDNVNIMPIASLPVISERPKQQQQQKRR